MAASDATPDYPRPLPQPKIFWLRALQVSLLVVALYGLGSRVFQEISKPDPADAESTREEVESENPSH